jgi:hypothetical protein
LDKNAVRCTQKCVLHNIHSILTSSSKMSGNCPMVMLTPWGKNAKSKPQSESEDQQMRFCSRELCLLGFELYLFHYVTSTAELNLCPILPYYASTLAPQWNTRNYGLWLPHRLVGLLDEALDDFERPKLNSSCSTQARTTSLVSLVRW